MTTNDWSKLLEYTGRVDLSLRVVLILSCLMVGLVVFLCYRIGRKGGMVGLGFLLWGSAVSQGAGAFNLRVYNDAASTIVVNGYQDGVQRNFTSGSPTVSIVAGGNQGCAISGATPYTSSTFEWRCSNGTVIRTTAFAQFTFGGTFGGVDHYHQSPDNNHTTCAPPASYTNYVLQAGGWTNQSGRILTYEVVVETNGVPVGTNFLGLLPGESHSWDSITNNAPTTVSVRNVKDWENEATDWFNSWTANTNVVGSQPGESNWSVPWGGNTQHDPVNAGYVVAAVPGSIPADQKEADRLNALMQLHHDAVQSDAILQVMKQQGAYLSNLAGGGGIIGDAPGPGLLSTNFNGDGWGTNGVAFGDGDGVSGGASGWLASSRPVLDASGGSTPVWTIPTGVIGDQLGGLPIADVSLDWGSYGSGQWATWAAMLREVLLVVEVFAAIYAIFRIVGNIGGMHP